MVQPSRNANKRSTQERKKKWQPAGVLTAPDPAPGMKNRWVRRMVHNAEDVKNVTDRLRQGYEPVHVREYDTLMAIEDGKHKGVAMAGDLMLMQVPEEIADSRTEYFDNMAEGLQAAIDGKLQREDNELMPLQVERKTSTTFGDQDREVSFQKDDED